MLDRLSRTIVGVMPQGFDLPRGSQIWVPFTMDKATHGFPVSPTRPIFVVSIVARRKPEVTPLQVKAEMNRLTSVIRAEYPKEFQKTGFRIDVNITSDPLQEHLIGQGRCPILVVTGAAAF